MESCLYISISENPAFSINPFRSSGVYRFMPSIIAAYLTEASSVPVDSFVTANLPPLRSLPNMPLKHASIPGQK